MSNVRIAALKAQLDPAVAASLEAAIADLEGSNASLSAVLPPPATP